MITPRKLNEQMKTMDDAQRTTFMKEHEAELAEMLRRVGDPGSSDKIEAREVELEREIEWCSQNPDPGIEPGALLWTTRKGERVPITVTTVHRFPEGRRRYTILKEGASEDWPEWFLMRRTRPT